ncbi:MAG: DMT family transporter [Proteobacteria bacterium]|nr:DMT family transporter [Pseudomonadota bacterium]
MNPSHNSLKGIGLVLFAMAILPFIDVCAKYLGQQGVPIAQLVWARFLFGSLFTLPFAASHAGRSAFRPVNPFYNACRAVLLILGTFFFFLALKHLSIADTLAIYFVQPILITALSPLLLGEHVGPRRWLSVAVGFIGVLIIIRPGLQAFNVGVAYALLAGFSSALYIIVTRHLTGRADAIVTTFQTSVIGLLPLTVALPFYWQAVSMNQWLLLGLMGAIAITGHFLITKAYDYAEASLLSPFNYTEMIMAVIAGWYFFGDFPDQWTFLGVAILISCAIYISWRERSLGKKDFPVGDPAKSE